jgi:uncharacterized protein (DUF58 family)
MISAELYKQIKAIQIRTNYLVNDILAGEYTSAFKGRGMEFEEVREYRIGDDVRNIDWNVTARMHNIPYVKEFREERELTVMLLVDVSSSGQFGSHNKLKNEVAAEVASILAYAAIKSNDKVGLIVFSDKIEHYIPPKKGRGHIWRVIRSILSFKPEGIHTDLSVPLEFLARVAHRKTVSFLISDFIAEDFKKPLQMSKKKHDLIAVSVVDPRELELPPIGFIELEDAETGETVLIDTYDTDLTKGFKLINQKQLAEREQFFRSLNVDHILIRTDRSYVEPVMRFFRRREKRL